MACTEICTSEHQQLQTERSRDELISEIRSAQAISGSNIDSGKLTTLLRIKFGAGAYNIHIMRNSYCIVAPRRLSLGEIDECRRR